MDRGLRNPCSGRVPPAVTQPPNPATGDDPTSRARESPPCQAGDQETETARRPSSVTPPTPRWRSTGALVVASVIVVIAIVVVFVILAARPAPSNSIATRFGPAPPSVVAAVTNPSTSVVDAVGTGGQTGGLKRIAATPLTDPSGKPQVIYVGAEYCPYCAAERWSLVMALARFGTFSGLQEMRSSPTDVDPNTATFTFHASTYSSSVISFQPVELEDRNQQPLRVSLGLRGQHLHHLRSTAVRGDAPGVSIFDIGGRFMLEGAGYDAALLQGLSWDQIASSLSDAGSPVTQAIVGNANDLTAAICSAARNQPSVCTSPTITGIEAALAAQPVVG